MVIDVEEKWFGIRVRTREAHPRSSSSELILGSGSHNSYAIFHNDEGVLVAQKFDTSEPMKSGEEAVVGRRFPFHKTIVRVR